MTNIRKKGMLVFILLVFLFSAFLSAGLLLRPKAYAVQLNYFSDEKYTKSDNLLNTDGSESNNKIRDFSKEVKSASNNTSFPELAQVIPLRYLESTETNAVFYYNGAEYGFYVAKEGERFDVLLIDFVFEFADQGYSDLEYKIRIEPILQQSFMRSSKSNGYEWRKCDGGYTYYVSMPRFGSELLNENSLNLGDSGYSKYSDDGLVINQCRLNFGNIGYATESDLEFGIFTVGFNLLFGFATGKEGTILSAVTSFTDTYNMRIEDTFVTSNEANIKTHMSKQTQLEDPTMEGYIRDAKLATEIKFVDGKVRDIILSADENSFAEFITVLNDTNYKSRLTEVCEFDIVRRNGVYSSMEFVTSAEIDSGFSFSRELILFDNQQPEFEIDNKNFVDTTVPVYLLPHGEQIISFTPEYSGTYYFESPSQTELTLNGISGNSFYLEKNVSYYLKVSNLSNQKVIGGFKCNIPQHLLPTSVSVNGNSSQIIRYCPNESGYKHLQFTSSSITLRILDNSFSPTILSDNGDLFTYFEQGKIYYLYITNSGSANKTVTIQDKRINNLSIVDNYTIKTDDKVMIITNPYDEIKQFTLIVDSDVKGRSVSLFDTDNMSMPGKIIDGQTQVISFGLEANGMCYIVFSHNDASINASLSLNTVQLIWVVDGNPIPKAVATLNRHDNDENGVGYKIELFALKNGNPSKKIQCKYEVFADDSRLYDFDGEYLKIPYFGAYNPSLSRKIHIRPVGYDGFSLAITIGEGRQDPTYTITFHEKGWDNRTYSRSVHYKSNMPVVPSPTKTGNVFKGYFNAPNGEGIPYYNEEMIPNSDRFMDEQNIVLYAYWEVIDYIVTLHIMSPLSSPQGNTRQIIVHYNEDMPDVRMLFVIPQGYTFDGFFDKMNGEGRKYYERQMVNDAQKADEMAYSQYLIEAPSPIAKWATEGGGDLYSYIEALECDYQYVCLCNECGSKETSEMHLKHGSAYNLNPPATLKKGCVFDYWNLITSSSPFADYRYHASLVRSSFDGLVYPEHKFFAVYQCAACVAQGTLITLADGTQVPVESLKGDEMLLVWNMLTGQYDASRILFIDKDATKIYKVINLGFSDGTTVKVISEHGFWDYNLNQYVYLRQDAAKYIGHWFNKGDTRVQLTSVDVRDEYTAAYSPVTYGHLCYYVNGMLSMPGGIGGLFNIFEVDPETMTINPDLMVQDIETYGLFTYEEFAELLPVSESVFNAFNGQYLKVAIGKGLITVEQLGNLVETYSQFFEGIQ